MKDILNKLAALADEADSEGQLDLANGIDGLIKTFAAGAAAPITKELNPPPAFVPNRGIMFIRQHEEFKNLSEEDKKKFLAANPDFVKNLGHLVPPTDKEVDEAFGSVVETKRQQDASKTPSVKEQHEKARQQMAQIAKLYTDAGRSVPFVVPPAGRATGQQILDFLEKAGRGGKLRSWNDMFARLKEIRGDAHLFALNMKPDPFGTKDKMLASNQFENLPADALKVELPKTPADIMPPGATGKGPPKPPKPM